MHALCVETCVTYYVCMYVYSYVQWQGIPVSMQLYEIIVHTIPAIGRQID